MKINLQGIKDNARYWFSTVAANIAASDAVGIEFFPFNVFYK